MLEMSGLVKTRLLTVRGRLISAGVGWRRPNRTAPRGNQFGFGERTAFRPELLTTYRMYGTKLLPAGGDGKASKRGLHFSDITISCAPSQNKRLTGATFGDIQIPGILNSNGR